MTRRPWWLLSCLIVCALPAACAAQCIARYILLPEQRAIEVRDPAQLPKAPLPPSAPPPTVATPERDQAAWNLSLDEAIQIALVNAKVIRVLTGVTAQSSGRTIYDAAITNTTIDQEQGRFDPVLQHQTSVNRIETPRAGLNPANPGQGVITGLRTDDTRNEGGLSKTNVLGGQWELNWSDRFRRFGRPGDSLLNPEDRRSLELGYTQPLLQGGGFAVNLAPVVIARINTERSFFQYKDSVQEYIRGVIEAYWNLVQARTDLWARQIQVNQAREAYDREEKRRKIAGLANLANVAQAKTSYYQFLANQVASEANVLDREAALRNLLFLPPGDGRQIIPVSMPTNQRLPHEWNAIRELAAERRPDIVELKLILEVDQLRLLQARNQTLPRLDAFALYRWNGLSGEFANGQAVSTQGGQFTDWSVGVNFSVPLGQRQARAAARQQELIIVRDLENLQQGLHAAEHDLAQSLRELDSSYRQYQAYKEARAAAFDNLLVQMAERATGRLIYLVVLQALNDWGNAVSDEARALIRYNVALATVERRTGTILETHGLVFTEERFRAAGPLGIFGHGRWYPAAVPPAGSTTRYPANPKGEPAENYFDLRNPAERERPLEEAPPPRIKELPIPGTPRPPSR